MTKKMNPELKQARALERERIRQRANHEKEMKRRKGRYPIWTTDDELKYLRKIGSHTIYSMPFTKLQLLEKYLITMENRVYWGHIESEKVKSYVQKSIRLIQDKQYRESLKPKVK